MPNPSDDKKDVKRPSPFIPPKKIIEHYPVTQAVIKAKNPQKQAQDMFTLFEIYLNQHPSNKVAITYSANNEQAEDIIDGYQNGYPDPKKTIWGGGQALPFHYLLKLILANNLQNRIHILPVATSLEAGGVGLVDHTHTKRDMQNIASHIQNGWKTFGLSDESKTTFLIGGHNSPKFPRSKEGLETKRLMGAMAEGDFSDPILQPRFVPNKPNPKAQNVNIVSVSYKNWQNNVIKPLRNSTLVGLKNETATSFEAFNKQSGATVYTASYDPATETVSATIPPSAAKETKAIVEMFTTLKNSGGDGTLNLDTASPEMAIVGLECAHKAGYDFTDVRISKAMEQALQKTAKGKQLLQQLLQQPGQKPDQKFQGPTLKTKKPKL